MGYARSRDLLKDAFNTDGFLSVVQESHPSSGYIHLDVDITGGSGQDFILIDISDTTNYPHTNTNYIHLDYVTIDIDAETNADYTISIGWLQNVDDTNGDFYEVTHVSGTKSIGQNKEIVRTFNNTGVDCRSVDVATSNISLNDTAFQTDVNLASTLDPSTTDTPSGNSDLVLRVTTTGGANSDFSIEINLNYHTH